MRFALPALLFLFISAALPWPLVAQSYSIAGSLINARNGGRVTHGYVSASLPGLNGRSENIFSDAIRADADENGHFSLTLPGPGVWRLTGSGTGFRSMPFEDHEGFYTGVVVNAASPSVQVVFRLTPNATIQGYVVDEAGEAVRTNAQVSLLREVPPSTSDERSTWQTRASMQTDDQGHYEFASLAPGRYEVMVQAQPWYAAGARHRSAANADTSSISDPLDMAYPLTWYPGVTNAVEAGILTLEGGESQEADLRLLPVPSIHLRIPVSPGEERRGIAVPQIRQVTPGNGSNYQALRPDFSEKGGLDLGGLAPGLYEVTTPGFNQHSSLLEIGAGSPRIVDLANATSPIQVTLNFVQAEGSFEPTIRFVDVRTGRAILSDRGSGSLVRIEDIRRRGLDEEPSDRGDERRPGLRSGRGRSPGTRTIELPPGQYEVSVDGTRGQHLTGMTAVGAKILGRTLTVEEGAPQVTFQIANGRATIDGVALLQGKGSAGAMILLVPAMAGEAQNSEVLRRAQTSTDGSFSLRDIIPGRYILIAIDHGWQVNWHDASTLQRYLLHGVPVDLSLSNHHHETITAQLP